MNAGEEHDCSDGGEEQAMFLDMDVTEEPLIDENIVSDDWVDPAANQRPTPKKFNERQSASKNFSNTEHVAQPMILVANKSLEKVLKRGHDEASAATGKVPVKKSAPSPGAAIAHSRGAPAVAAAKAANMLNAMSPAKSPRPSNVSARVAGPTPQTTIVEPKSAVVRSFSPNAKNPVMSMKASQSNNQAKYVNILPSVAGSGPKVSFSKTSATQQSFASGGRASTVNTTLGSKDKPQQGLSAQSKSPLEPIPTKQKTASSSVGEGQPIVIKDIRQCIPEESDSLHVLHAKLDYTNQMLKTQQTLIARLKHQSGVLMKSNAKLSMGLKSLEALTQTAS